VSCPSIRSMLFLFTTFLTISFAPGRTALRSNSLVEVWVMFVNTQALLNLMYNGFGSLIGYLACGWWFAACTRPAGTQWPVFWSVLAAAMAVVLVYFLVAYQGRRAGPQHRHKRARRQA